MVTITMLEESSPVVHSKPSLGGPAPREEEKARLYRETRLSCMAIFLYQEDPRGYGHEDSLSMNVDEEDTKGKETVLYEGKGNERKRKRGRPKRDPMWTPAFLPNGWTHKIFTRTGGKSKGRDDVFYYSPDNKKFRSKHEVLYFLEHNRKRPRNRRMLEVAPAAEIQP